MPRTHFRRQRGALFVPQPAPENLTEQRSQIAPVRPGISLLNDLAKFFFNLLYLVNADFDVDRFVELFDEFGYIFRNAYEIEPLSNADVVLAHVELPEKLQEQLTQSENFNARTKFD
jgi:hypothetical protein